MAPANGDTVRVHYTGILDDGSCFDSSDGRDPLEFTVGAGQVIPGFDAAVADLEVGATAKVTIAAANAYGDYEDDAVQEVPLEAFGEQKPEVGWMIEVGDPAGQRMAAVVAAVGEGTATLDFNHPLAGKNLTFEIQLVEILQA